MTQHQLEELHSELNTESIQLQKLGDYSAEAPAIRRAIRAVLILTRNAIEDKKEIAKLKRGVTSVRPKKKK